MGRRLDLTGKKYLAGGSEGLVYGIGNKVIKVPDFFSKDLTSSRTRILRLEYKIQKDLYEAGISVPQPYGVIRVLDSTGKRNMGLVMEKIEGKVLGEIPLEKINYFTKKRDEEIVKAENLGFKLGDRFYHGNTMVDKTGKLFLIDFGKRCSSPKKLEEAV